PSAAFDWAWERRRGLLRAALSVLVIGYCLSGITLVGPNEVGVLQLFGRFRPPLLGPGLHLRWPAPVETVTKAEPDLVRVARGGLAGPSSGPDAVAWSASHGVRRDDAALFFTGDENLVELSGVVEYRLTAGGVADLLFGVARLDEAVTAAAEGAFRE